MASPPVKAIAFGIVAALLLIYAVVGILFLVRDQAVVKSCHTYSQDVHVIWHTDLWTYSLCSVVLATVAAAWLLCQATVQRSGKSSVLWEESEPMDWRLLWDGFCVMTIAAILSLFAYWGHAEVYQSLPWCDNKHVAFKELDLYNFGRATFFGQLGAAGLLWIAGWLYWLTPFGFEIYTAITGKVPEIAQQSQPKKKAAPAQNAGGKPPKAANARPKDAPRREDDVPRREEARVFS